ncbi:hypothetical protein Tco_1000744, partial [Tanacetum coccineum]
VNEAQVTLPDSLFRCDQFGGVTDWYQSQGYGEPDPVISSSSTVTYTYTDFEPGRVFWGADEELSDGGPEHPPSPNYVPDPEYLPLPVEVPYVPEPEYPEYLVPADAEAPLEDQPLPADASPTALSPGYVADSDPDEDPKEDPEEDHADYPADRGDDDDEPSDDDDDDTDDEDEEPFEDEDDDEEEEHLALADSSAVPIVDPVPLAGDIEEFETDESASTPQIRIPFAQTRLRRARKTVRLEPPMSPSMEARIAEYAAAPTPPSPPPSPLSPWSPPLPHILSSPLPPPPSSLHLPPPIPTSLPLPSSLLPPLPYHYQYEVGESLNASLRPTGGHRADYMFIGTMDAEIRCQRAKEVGYSIRDVWVDPTYAVEEVAPTTLKGVNARVTELAVVQEQDTQDIYVLIEDGQDIQTQLFQRVDGLVEDRQFHYETARLLDHEAHVSREAWAYFVGLSSGQLSAALGQIQALQDRDQTHADDPEGAASMNNIPPRRSSATARAAAAAARADAAAAATPMTAATIEQLIEARVSVALANHDTLRNSTNGHGDGSQNSEIGIRGTGTKGVVVLSQWFEKMESVFHISNCDVENQKALKKMMTVKYCPRGEIKKLEIELWNLKVKGTDVARYTLRFQELALMCRRMFHEESEEVEKYVGRLPDMIRMNQKVLTITERQAEQKRKLEFNAGNNQGHQQQNKR